MGAGHAVERDTAALADVAAAHGARALQRGRGEQGARVVPVGGEQRAARAGGAAIVAAAVVERGVEGDGDGERAAGEGLPSTSTSSVLRAGIGDERLRDAPAARLRGADLPEREAARVGRRGDLAGRVGRLALVADAQLEAADGGRAGVGPVDLVEARVAEREPDLRARVVGRAEALLVGRRPGLVGRRGRGEQQTEDEHCRDQAQAHASQPSRSLYFSARTLRGTSAARAARP